MHTVRKKRVIRLLFPFPLCEVLCRVLFCPIMLDIFLNNAILVYEANNEKKESTHPQSLYNECAGYVMNAVFVCCLRRNSNWFSAYILNSRSFGIQLFSLENAWFSFFCAFRAVCERIFFSYFVLYNSSAKEGWIVASMVLQEEENDIIEPKRKITSKDISKIIDFELASFS